MKSELLKQIRKTFNQKKVKRNKRILIFTLFTILSTTIWFFSKLEKEYFTTISFPVKFYNFPKNKIQINKLPKELKINVFGQGFNLLKYKIIPAPPIPVDLTKMSSSKTENDKEIIYFNSESIIHKIDRALASEVKILSIEPRIVKLVFSEKQTKKVVVVPNLNYIIHKDYILDKIIVNPQYILVTGPAFILDSIDTIYTMKFQVHNLSQNSKYKIRIQKNSLCTYSNENIDVNIKVQKKTEKTIPIPIESIFLYKFENKKFVPSTINLIFTVGVSDYQYIEASDFQFEFKKLLIRNSTNEYYLIRLKDIPENVLNAKITPSIITVINK